MILLSHGNNTNLLEHIRETMQAGISEFARAAFACHDIGKATIAWQKYIRNPGGCVSPHPHAGAGALLAAALLHRIGATPLEELAAMHCIAAHHSGLCMLNVTIMDGTDIVAHDPQAKAFFLDKLWGIASLLPQISDDKMVDAWSDFVELSHDISDRRQELAERIKKIPNYERLTAYLLARAWLGALCYTDRVSAKKQSKKISEFPEYAQTFDAPEFQLRPAKQLPSGQNKVYELRSVLRTKFLKLVESKESLFIFLDAPTGMGKTETMLQAAELLRTKTGTKRIIYAVPQVSIADQIYEDYFASYHAKSAQIWNYRRKENTKDTQPETDNTSDRAALLFEAHPFKESYNITTFNQVLLSSLHPARERCIMNEGMRDAVIIMDEFHKLPMTILPLFFPAARAFAERNHCRFLFGSATPFELLPYWSIEDAAHLDKSVTEPLYSAQEIDMRREYINIGSLNINDLAETIEARHTAFHEENLLVVVNLINEASWPLRRHFTAGYQPWLDLERLENLPKNERRIYFLDGLTPPILRREIVVKCRQAMMAHIPVTMIATQMIEVGVDLDFDRALCDYQGLAATIQRGGRVGREGRCNGKSRPVEVFSLITSDGQTTSFEMLNGIMPSYPNKHPLFQECMGKTDAFHQKEVRYLRKWSIDSVKHDSDLIRDLVGIQQKVFARESLFGLWCKLFTDFAGSPQKLGCTFEYAHYIAEIGVDSFGEEILVVPDKETAMELCELDKAISNNQSNEGSRERYRKLLTSHRIVVNSNLLTELGLSKYFLLTNPDPVKCFWLFSAIF